MKASEKSQYPFKTTLVTRNQILRLLSALLLAHLPRATVLCAADTPISSYSGFAPQPVIFYVSPDGGDSNAGTSSSPFKTIRRAQEAVRTVNRKMTTDIVVYLKGGRYEQTEPLVFGPEDGGMAGHYVRYEACPGETPVVSGGKRVTGWKKVPGQNYYVASVPVSEGFFDYFRQLYVNGVRAYHASSSVLVGSGFYYDPKNGNTAAGINFPKSAIRHYKNKTDLRLFHISSFKTDEWPVVDVVDNGEFTAIKCMQPYFQARVNRGKDYLTGNDQFIILNAFEELKRPGEWYHDRAEQKIYYFPYPNQNMTIADTVVPAISGDYLLGFVGTATNALVCNISMSGIVFEHSNWMFPKDHFIGGSQAEMLFGPADGVDAKAPTKYCYQVPGGIFLNHTRGIRFVNNIVRHMGACGIQLYNDVSGTLLEGNIFHDTTGAGLLIGRSQGAYFVGDIPNEGRVVDNVISNNVIRDTGRDFMQATGISIMPALRTRIVHNDIADTAFMGIHSRMEVKGNYLTKDVDTSLDIGEGFIAYNRVGEANWAAIYGVDDNGSIYNFGPAKDTVIFQNLILKANALQGIYNDNNSYRITWRQNVILGSNHLTSRSVDFSTIIFDGNYSTCPPPASSGSLCYGVVSNFTQLKSEDPATWPEMARKIAENAGLEPAFRHLLSKVPPTPRYDYYIRPGENLATVASKSGDSGNWKDLDLLWDGMANNGEARVIGDSAWIEFNFNRDYSHMVFSVTKRAQGPLQGTEWKVQTLDAKTGEWVDATPFIGQTADKIQTRPAPEQLAASKIRLVVQIAEKNGRIGLIEFRCVGVPSH